MSDKKENAVTHFNTGYNCAQSVLTPFAKQLDVDVPTALKLSSGFGAGMGRMQETCGAMTGAYMVLGLKYGQNFPDDESKEKVIGLIQEFTERFKKEHGHTTCRDLLKVDMKTSQGQQEFQDKKLHEKVCSKCVGNSVNLLEEIVKREG